MYRAARLPGRSGRRFRRAAIRSAVMPVQACPNRRIPHRRVSPACVAMIVPSVHAIRIGMSFMSSWTRRCAPGLKPGAWARTRANEADPCCMKYGTSWLPSSGTISRRPDSARYHEANRSMNRIMPVFDTCQSSHMSPSRTIRSACSRSAMFEMKGSRSPFACRSPANRVRFTPRPLPAGPPCCPTWRRTRGRDGSGACRS